MTSGGPTRSDPTSGGPQWDAFPPGQTGALPSPPYSPAYPGGAYPGNPYPGAPYPAYPPYPQPGAYYGGYGGPPRVRRSVRELGMALLGVGALGVVGSVAPWAWARFRSGSYRFDDIDVTATGLDGGGALTVALCAAVAIMGAILISRTLLGLSITALCCGATTTLIGLANLASINSVASEVEMLDAGEVGVAWGLWVVIASGAAATIVGLIALLRGRWVDPSTVRS